MELYKLTVHEIRDMIKNRKTNSTEVTESILKRIEEMDSEIGSYLTVCKDEAIERAKSIQQKIERHETNSDLAGIPMALKDNICTKNILTTCASKILSNFKPPYNATVVNKLNENDTVLLGKLNMDEFAMGSSTENSGMKITRNPWDKERVPGGSSGGSTAAVASHMASFALGSDTGGSIRQPASLCGVVGMKPTYGTVSRYGLVAFASSLDQIGPITKDVEDCALVLNAITGHDHMDSTSADIEYKDFTKALVNSVKGMKIGIPSEYLKNGINEEVKNSIISAIEQFRKLGAICEEVSLPMTEYAIPAYYIISSAEASSNLARFDGIKYGVRAEQYEDLLDLYVESRSRGFGDEVKRRIMLGTYGLSSGYYDAYYKKALKARTLIKDSFNKVFEEYDLLVGPTTPKTAFKIGEKMSNPLEMYLEDIYTVSVNIAGIPAISIPCGFDSKNLPIGMQLIGKAFDEKTLIRAAYTFEQNTDFNKIRVGER